MVFVCAFGLVPLFAVDPFLGTWMLNLAESRFARAAPASMMMVWEKQGDGVKVTTRGTGANGVPFKSEYRAVYNGKETQRKGPWNWDVVINRQVSEREREDTFKKNGRVDGRSRLVVSEDGKCLVINLDYGDSSSVRVFDRQP